MTISKMYGTAVKKILLIGDSIRMGYCRFVRELMQGEAEVFYPEDNCRFAQYTLRGLQDWQAQLGLWNGVDLIHWNNGLWDAGHLGIGATAEAEALTIDTGTGLHRYEKDPLTPPEIYAYFIHRIAIRMKTLFPAAGIIFADSTPVVEEQCPEALSRNNAEIRQYNSLAREALREIPGITFNDLHTFARNNAAHLHSDWVHFNEAGSRLLAAEVVRVIRERLAQ